MAQPEIALLLELVLDLKKDQTVIKDMTIENKVTLDDHARRSTASEERHKITEARLAMLENRDLMINGFFKISMSLLGLAATVIGILVALKSLL